MYRFGRGVRLINLFKLDTFHEESDWEEINFKFPTDLFASYTAPIQIDQNQIKIFTNKGAHILDWEKKAFFDESHQYFNMLEKNKIIDKNEFFKPS